MFPSVVPWTILLLTLTDRAIATYLKLSTVTGYFLQDDLSTNATGFDYTKLNFGLINQTYMNPLLSSNQTQWQQFAHELTTLNANTPISTSYRLLFLGRHGEGYHNTAESYYGTPAWNCYWSLLNGNGSTTWVDAHLTDIGTNQALANNAFWYHLLSDQKITLPQSYYVSPLYRCLQTANYTFTGLPIEFIPTIKELLREGISEHTCDHRSSRSLIHAAFPTYLIEPGFVELDPLWTGIDNETPSGQDTRSKTVLEDILSHDDSQIISITSHSGEIASLLRVLGHRVFPLATGGIIPVLIRVEEVEEPISTSVGASRTPSPYCTEPPVTSLPASGCVCPSGIEATILPLVTQP